MRIALLFVAIFCMALSVPVSAGDLTPTTLQVINGDDTGATFLAPRGLVFDPKFNDLLVANPGRHRIEIVSRQGRVLTSFIHRVVSDSLGLRDGLPMGLAIDSMNRVLVADNLADYVDVLDSHFRGIAQMRLDATAAGCSTKVGPVSMAVTPNGDILVANRGPEGRLFRFDRNYKFLGWFGQSGHLPGQLTGITGLSVLPNGNIVTIAALTELAVQIFSPDGQYLSGFGRHDVGPGNFSLPSGVVVTPDGKIWVTDEIRQTVQIFDAAGQYLGMFGGKGLGPGAFLYPSGIASDGQGCLAVAERVGNRIQIFQIDHP